MIINHILPKNNTLTIKISSLILGCIIWAHYAPQRTITTLYNVPVCFYNTEKMHTIHAPETVSIYLRGKRCELAALDTDKLAVHIDIAQMQSGEYPLEVTHKTLLLPNQIQVVYYKPINSTIKI